MTLMNFMEGMGTSDIAILAAFFIGLMTAISPCPLATNITAIAYVSRKINNSKHTLIVGLLYTLGRMFTYVVLTSLIVWFGLNMQTISLFLQKYGDILLGPLLLIIGFVMLDIVKLNFPKGSGRLNNLKEKIAEKGFFGSFLLGVIFALAFCPFSGVLFFGMMIPIAIKAGDGLIIPCVFAFATGLPVIIFSFILTYSASLLSKTMIKVQIFEKWMRRITGIIFIGAGFYQLVF
ncbi:aromatic aminobenezylarsenical efflux permease ArsG family transporter [Candidatus Woesearchaeota archaeon]|nr:aromatic aminobenezylarsenical efflux permease ArsG family transporter [Candidatus Woesearchaeota archaeon]